jgi:hypothetical protein
MTGLAQRDSCYRLLNGTVGWFADYLRICRRSVEFAQRLRNEPRLRFVHRFASDLVVAQGPFKGMRYPAAESSGSAFVPKITGSYECELHQVVEELCARRYQLIVDIGCAEGYYAVGLGLRLPESLVFAFDTNVEAADLCRRMAALNGIADRVFVGGWCDGDRLALLTRLGRTLIICDTEGYEKTLFSESVIAALTGHDLLIETHDLFERGISDLLQERFQGTHELRVIESLTDADKSRTYRSSLLEMAEPSEREDLVAEGRGEIMKWLYLTSRDAHA